MKEIKFRQYIESEERFHYWGYLDGESFTCPGSYKYPSKQYTGLKDSNGADIYEGDVVIVNESHKLLNADFGKNKRVVQWRESGACLDMLHVDYLDAERKVGLTFDNGMIDSIKVIGNIHENPELLEG